MHCQSNYVRQSDVVSVNACAYAICARRYQRLTAFMLDRSTGGTEQQFTGSNIGAIWRTAANARGPAAGTDASRMTTIMIAPGMHVMNGIWKAMAWVQEDIEDEEQTSSDEGSMR
jgi:hypothetical protein